MPHDFSAEKRSSEQPRRGSRFSKRLFQPPGVSGGGCWTDPESTHGLSKAKLAYHAAKGFNVTAFCRSTRPLASSSVMRCLHPVQAVVAPVFILTLPVLSRAGR